MKAAVINKLGETPKYKNFPAPEIQNDNQILMEVKMAAVKNLDKIRASGEHYARHKELPAVVGM
ncbi:MAG: quinone oxidoreductase family protein, partial [Psychroflexus sp.]